MAAYDAIGISRYVLFVPPVPRPEAEARLDHLAGVIEEYRAARQLMDAGEARALSRRPASRDWPPSTPSAGPHLVPVTFAFDGEEIVTAVDHKPKRTTRLRRLENIEANPRVSVLADNYEDDWSKLWWARADGMARIAEPGASEHERAISALAARYPQYVEERPSDSVIVISVSRWSGWRAGR